MSTIRPPVWPQAPSQAPGGARAPADSARAAAQKAFFEAALGRAQGPAAPEAPRAAEAAPPVVHAIPLRETRIDPAEEPPQRILRPGSLLNILV